MLRASNIVESTEVLIVIVSALSAAKLGYLGLFIEFNIVLVIRMQSKHLSCAGINF